MKILLFLISFLCIPFLSIAQNSINEPEKRVISVIDSSQTGYLLLKQSFDVNVSLDSVWNAYTTEKGWESWAVSIAEIDFKINGTIKTNYNIDGYIGDESTITLHVINYIPKKMLTLQVEFTSNFPEFMKADEKDLRNSIFFEKISPSKTKVVSYGIGYKNNEKYRSLMNFFVQGNEQSYLNLIEYLETGIPSVNY